VAIPHRLLLDSTATPPEQQLEAARCFLALRGLL
jgi:hypothetical protein